MKMSKKSKIVIYILLGLVAIYFSCTVYLHAVFCI